MASRLMGMLSIWISALRPRTLILVVSGTIAAIAVALPYGVNWVAAVLVLLTALSLQILSNLANDYGDTIHGADNAGRIGPIRSVQAGHISWAAMKRAMLFAAIVSAVSGGLLLIYVYRMVGPAYFVGFLGIGAFAIWAAIAYTATDNPYGYRGLGDIMVFIFFGVVMVSGGAGLIAGQFTFDAILLGAGLGFIATAVLNVNNMRDIENDRQAGKHTIAARLGHQKAKTYHSLLLFSAALSFLLFSLFFTSSIYGWTWALFAPLLLIHLKQIFEMDAHSLDRLIPQLAVFSLLVSVSFLIHTRF